MTSPTSALLRAFNVAAAAYGAGKLVDAERICQRLIVAKPDFFDALHLLAVVQASLGKHDLALGSYDRAISVRPFDADALYNRGATLRYLKRFDEALASYDQALSVRPDHAETLNNRGAALHKLRRLDEALASYDRLLALRPDHAKALNNRGNVLQDMKRLDEALVSYDRARAAQPEDAEAYKNMAAVLRVFGRSDEARDCIERAIRISPGVPALYLSLAQSQQFAAGDPRLAAMLALAQDTRAFNAEEKIYLHFALGKALADVQQHEQAFHHLLQGNALKRLQIDYDESGTLRFFQRNQTVFTPKLMHAKHGLGNPSDVPVFIVGMPRSGSTLVEQILASHPKVFGAGELDHFASTIASLCLPRPFPEGIAALSGDQLRQLGTSYLDITTALAPGAARITDKDPLNFAYVGLIHLALPRARIIHTLRDPVDTCLSCFSALFASDFVPFSYDLGELGRYYRGYEALMRHWRHVLPDGVMLEVKYEDVVDDLEGQARRILAHCRLDWDDACLAFYKTQRPVRTASATQVRQPIYRSSVGRWRPTYDLMQPLLEGLNIEAANPAIGRPGK